MLWKEKAPIGWYPIGANAKRLTVVHSKSISHKGCTNRLDVYKRQTYAYETFTLTQERGRRFRIDADVVDDSGFGFAAANAVAEMCIRDSNSGVWYAFFKCDCDYVAGWGSTRNEALDDAAEAWNRTTRTEAWKRKKGMEGRRWHC